VGRSQVPEDLIADIEAFKQEVRAEKREKTPADDVEEEIPPQRLRLPKNVRKRLPDFVMTAHIYDRESSKRFVLINGIKTREGENSLEDITVEQILPDGAVLSYEGHKFFQSR
jgi:general secretion pathway protein B